MMNGRTTILLDNDGTLRDIFSPCIGIYKREYDPQCTLTAADIKNYDMRQYFPKLPLDKDGLPDIETVFFTEHAEEVFQDALPYEVEVAEILAQIRQDFNAETYLVTLQKRGNEKYTLNWLENYNIHLDGIMLITYDEKNCTKNKDIIRGEVALDDYIRNLEDYAKVGTIPVCFDRPWNQDWSGKRVKSLYGFYLLLQDLKRK